MRRALLATALFACGEPTLPMDQLAPPGDFDLVLLDPFIAGTTVTLEASGTLGRNEIVYFARGNNLNGGPCLDLAGGQCIDLSNPAYMGLGRANGAGVATLDVTLPPQAPPGLDVSFQALVVRGIDGAGSLISDGITATVLGSDPGCTDSTATNYDPGANVDDGSCSYLCGNGTCVDEFTVTADTDRLDVVMVLDTSDSMSGYTTNLVVQAGGAISALAAAAPDWRLALISADMDDPNQSGRILASLDSFSALPGLALSGAMIQPPTTAAERVFDATLAALTPPLSTGANAGFRRNNARLAVLAISDEDDQSVVGRQNFIGQLDNLSSRGATYSGMVGADLFDFSVQCSPTLGGPPIALFAPRHQAAIGSSGGIWSPFCSLDLVGAMGDMASNAVGIDRSFPLACEPTFVSSIVVRIDGAVESDWSFDGTDVVLDDIPTPGADVAITYDTVGPCN